MSGLLKMPYANYMHFTSQLQVRCYYWFLSCFFFQPQNTLSERKQAVGMDYTCLWVWRMLCCLKERKTAEDGKDVNSDPLWRNRESLRTEKQNTTTWSIFFSFGEILCSTKDFIWEMLTETYDFQCKATIL